MIDWKTAKAAERHAEIKRISKEMGDHRFFTGKELRRLPKLLAPGEPVLAFVSGYMAKETWLVVLTDRRVMFLDANMFFGGEQISVALEKINTVEAHTGLVFGDLKIEDGNNEHFVNNIFKGAAERFADKVREAMEARRTGGMVRAIGAEDDVISKLERLSALRAQGALSDAEFEAQKAKLLAG